MDNTRRICIPSSGPETGDLVDDRFGRAPFFMIYDTGTKKTEGHKNPACDGMGGVGPKAAQFLITHGVTVLVAERVGGNALEALKAGGIAVLLFDKKGATVGDAIEAFLQGELGEQ
jgi:predicted Fe-Mo cluster-binding NifX family protein